MTSNAAELRSLLSLAKENGVFFMEAMWTKFQPLSKEVQKIAAEGTLGNPVVLHADMSGDCDINSKLLLVPSHTSLPTWYLDIPKTHRILDPKLGGGALLDL